MLGSGNSQIMRILSALDYFNEGSDADKGQNEREDSHPHCRTRGNPYSLICGAFFHVAGFAFLKLAFDVSDESHPPTSIRVSYWANGRAMLWLIAWILEGFMTSSRHE